MLNIGRGDFFFMNNLIVLFVVSCVIDYLKAILFASWMNFGLTMVKRPHGDGKCGWEERFEKIELWIYKQSQINFR